MTDSHESIAAFLQARVIERATGRSEILVVDNRPRNVFFAGTLLPRPDAVADSLESAEDFYARLAPSAMQLRFLLPRVNEVAISVAPLFHVYYRVIPPYDAQRRRTPKADDGIALSEPLVRAFRKCDLALSKVPFALTVKQGLQVSPLSDQISASLSDAIHGDSTALRPRDKWLVPRASLGSEQALVTWCHSVDTVARPPLFAVDVEAELLDCADPTASQVVVTIVNRSKDAEEFERSDYWDLAIFDAGLHVSVETSDLRIAPYVFAALPNSYRFDRDQWGAGVNCVPRVDPDRRRISAESVATHVQARLEHRVLHGVDITFGALAKDPLPALRAVLERMSEYRERAWMTKHKELLSLPNDHIFRAEFDRDLSDYDREIAEFRLGVELLSNPAYSMLRKAFCLANDAFDRARPLGVWYLFQLVFIVRNLTVLAAREWNEVSASDDVEVLWFPTGGGKTEAFLGLLVAALFFDRLRGRSSGVTGVVRLPLRLLTLQQFQRVVKVVAAAESVRRAAGVSGKAFSVGYWVGEGGSPNTVDATTAAYWETNPDACQKWRKVRECPFCRAKVVLRFNRELWSLAHHCTAGTCGNKGDLPVYIVDDELYRFLPSIVVGTVDKLAAFGFQQRFGNLLGWPLGVCSKHGYSPREECLVPGCKESVKAAQLKDPVPAILVQDELHLLKEDLGAFDGHYETAVMGAQADVPNGKPWKVIAATATIEQFDWQAYHLYCKEARRFPCPGPSWQDTFYSNTTSQTNRLFLGILPFNRSHINAMISALWIYHHEIRKLRKLLAEDAEQARQILKISEPVDAEALGQTLRDYEVSLTYVLTRKAGDQMAESLATQVAGYLRDEGESPLEIRSLTGQTSGVEIEDILDALDRGGKRVSPTIGSVDAIVATSMISHGVDVERLNFIAFFGMPRLTAEYIQASSRVGRRFPGLALIVYSPARERDRSHFHLFAKYHEYLERLVEPPAINRWAQFAVRHTLPGIFVGSVIQVLARQLKKKLYLESELYAALHVERTTNMTDLVRRVVGYYSPDSDHATALKVEIERHLELFLNGLRKKARRTLWQQQDFRPMMSLRDVEEPVYFMASKYSAKAFELWMKRRRSGGRAAETTE